MTDVFISYAREDAGQAERIARGLEAMGLTVFWDNEIPPRPNLGRLYRGETQPMRRRDRAVERKLHPSRNGCAKKPAWAAGN